MTRATILLLLILGSLLPAGGPPVFAGQPDVSCRSVANGCNFGSDILVFAQGDAIYEIDARITQCLSCTPPDPTTGIFSVILVAKIDFGPYDPGLCSPAGETLGLTLNQVNLKRSPVPGGPGGNEPTYIPANLNQVFVASQSQDLKTSCVSADNLDYRIPKVSLTGLEGAKTGLLGMNPPEAVVLRLPEPVRAAKGAALLDRIEIDRFRLPQSLSILAQQTEGPGSQLRFWPDGLPFRLGPHVIRYVSKQVTFDAPGPAGGGPVAYSAAPPATSNLTAAQIVRCGASDPEPLPGSTCTGSDSVWNAGYLEAGWVPSASVQFDNQGMTLALSLAAVDSMVYQPLFPKGVWLKLNGPASINIEDSQLVPAAGQTAAGWFTGGTGWLELPRDKCSAGPGGVRRRRFDLNGGSQQPQIGPGGRLLAGVTDLNEVEATTLQPQKIDWTYNEARELGCGTLFVPEILTDQSPQRTWLASAVPPVLGRGVYAGFNFNRNRVCAVAGQPQYQPTGFCSGDGDCDTAQGETCIDGGFSPRCPYAVPSAKWKTTINQEPLTFSVLGQKDREMAFLARGSGVSGVFDAGDDLNQVVGDQNANPPEFVFEFDTFGLAFKESRSERADTIVDGNLVVAWPSDTDIPLRDMQVCDCGMPDGARTPDVLLEKKLRYWDAAFSPYGVTFSPDSAPHCPGGTLASSTCPQTGASQSAQSAAIDALTPVPRFSPDPDACVGLVPAGQAGPIVPYSISRLAFDKDSESGDGTAQQKPYVYDVEQFALSTWPGNLAAPRPAVIPPQGQQATADYGFYDAGGDLLLPFFGLTPAGIAIGLGRNPETNAHADLHRECPAQDPDCGVDPTTSFVWARRKMAADNLDIPFRVDYFRADRTADPDDGWNDPATQGKDDIDRPGKSRGTLFAFAAEEGLDPNQKDDEMNLGAVKVAGALMMQPDDSAPSSPAAMKVVGGDLGPAAAVRLWGAAKSTARSQLKNIFPCNGVNQPCAHFDNWGSAYDAALTRLAAQEGYLPWLLPNAADLRLKMHGTQKALEPLLNHPDAQSTFNVESSPPGGSPTVVGSQITGLLHFSPDLDQLDGLQVGSNLDTGGRFFKLDAALLDVDRHVKEGEQAITSFAKESLDDAGKTMQLPGKQDIPFPSVPGMEWDFDYSVTPQSPFFQFNSLTGSIDLAAGGGLSGIGLDKLGATLKFWNDGDWYFTAGLRVNFDGNSVSGDLLLGNTKDMTPLQDIDKNVFDFLEGVPKFDGAYVSAGASANVWDWGCILRITAGGQVAGWYISNSYGGKVQYYVSGKAICLVSLKGDMSLVGGVINDQYKIQGSFWLAGGAGLCDEDEWVTPEDVLDDDFCVACVVGMTGNGHYPPKDLDITFKKDYLECAGP